MSDDDQVHMTLKVKIRRTSDGQTLIAYVDMPEGKGPVVLGSISAKAADEEAEIREDWQALMIKTFKHMAQKALPTIRFNSYTIKPQE
jgi:hypothetical protein